ncbi:hypothetical protein [Methyloligella solikamskensis]|uniref:Transcriptional regulator n=1 Tax=Methyloligella solikamskensis TaxID=1177756 RepID=A0ABW3J8D2_9HYPH
MTKSSLARLSAAKLKGEALFERRLAPQELIKQERQVASDAISAKTERLRALRLAREAAEKQDAPIPGPGSVARKKVRRSKQT